MWWLFNFMNFFFCKKNGNLVSNDFDTSLSDNESDYESDDN